MKSTCLSQRIESSFLILHSDVNCGIRLMWMDQLMAVRSIDFSWIEISLVKVAAKATVNEVLVSIVASL